MCCMNLGTKVAILHRTCTQVDRAEAKVPSREASLLLSCIPMSIADGAGD